MEDESNKNCSRKRHDDTPRRPELRCCLAQPCEVVEGADVGSTARWSRAQKWLPVSNAKRSVQFQGWRDIEDATDAGAADVL